MRAPRRSACSRASRMTMPAPSPMTKPSRVASKGREAFSGSSLRVEMAFIAQKPATLSLVIGASVPPAIIASASPRWMMRMASPMALPPGAQAVTTLLFGPFAPVMSGTTPAAPPPLPPPPPPGPPARPGDVLFDVLPRLTDLHDLLRVFVGDLDLELLLQRHHQLDHVQGVGPQVLHKGCLRGDLGLIHAQLLDDDAFHAVEYGRHYPSLLFARGVIPTPRLTHGCISLSLSASSDRRLHSGRAR